MGGEYGGSALDGGGHVTPTQTSGQRAGEEGSGPTQFRQDQEKKEKGKGGIKPHAPPGYQGWFRKSRGREGRLHRERLRDEGIEKKFPWARIGKEKGW